MAPDDDVASIRDAVGDGLRTVAAYDPEGYEFYYQRADVAESVTEEQVDRIHDEIVIQGLGKAHLEDLFDAGSLHCSVHHFEEVTTFHLVRDEASGLFVSVDADTDVELPGFVDRCRDLL